MAGIVSCGIYIPLWRLDLGALSAGLRGEKAIANFDEDSLTMGVAAGLNCLSNVDRSKIDGLYFATTTSPYKEKQISVVAAAALDLRNDILTADFGNSLRAGTTALIAAINAVKAGSARQVMVIATDMRLPMPGSEFEQLFGDGAAAFIIGEEDIRVDIQDSYSFADEILDLWRADDDRFVRSWEGRFTLDEGYFRVLPVPVMTLMERNKLTPVDFNRAVFYAPDARRHREMAARLGFDPAQVQPPIFGSVGDTGAASSLMMLVAALEEATPGGRMLLANYGSGADAFLLQVIKEFKMRNGLKSYVGSKRVIKDYKTYLRWRELVEMTMGRRRPATPTPSASAIWRERDKNIRFYGVKCNHCGTVQYPPQRVCVNCHTKDDFENYRFSDKKAELFTYTLDYASPTPDPPIGLAVVNFDGGGRMWVYMTDKDENEIEIGMPVEMTFRKLFTMEGIHNYYWKCMPVRIKEDL
ncbi:OB-fold domain-containing protein [Chloroflexota bacterium]